MRLLAVPVWREGDAFEDRIDTACHLNGIDRRSFLGRLGLLAEAHVPEGWGRWITPDAAGRLADVFETDAQTVHSGVLASYDGVCFPPGSIRKVPKDLIRDGWVFISGTRVCPACWDETGVERVRDRLPWTFGCTRHRCLLADLCAGCGRRFRAGADSDRAGPRFLSIHPVPGHCCNQPARGTTIPGLGSSPCGTRYDQNRLVAAPDTVLDAQAVVDRALDGDPPQVLGGPVTSLEFFEDIRSIGALLPRSGPDRDTRRPYLRPPAAAEDMATITATALDVLSCPSVDSAARRLLPIVESHLGVYDSTTLALLGRTRPTARTRPLLDATLALVGRPSTRLRRSIQPTLPIEGIDVDQITVVAVANLLDCFEPVAQRLGVLREDLLLIAAAMDLARIAGLPSFPASAVHLRFEDPNRAAGQARYVRTRIRDAGLVDDWIRACRRAIERLTGESTHQGDTS